MKPTALSFYALCAVLTTATADETQYWKAPDDYSRTYWVNGFSLDNPETWNFDVDKLNNKMPGDKGADEVVQNGGILDGHYCWAASGANIAAQWEAKNVETVRKVLNRDPLSAEEIFTEFSKTFFHESGSTTNATDWYFNGVKNHGLLFKNDAPSTEGGYYKGAVTYSEKYEDFFRMNNNGWTIVEGIAMSWDESVYRSTDIHKMWANSLIDFITDGYSISIAADGIYKTATGIDSYSHALTLWGVEVDADGYLTRMWLTDSDDATSFSTDMGLFSVSLKAFDENMSLPSFDFTQEEPTYAPLTGLAGYYSMQADVADIVEGTPKYWYNAYDTETGLGDYMTSVSAVKVTSLVGKQNIIPEPTTATLSLLVLAALASRRRR